MCEYKCLDYIYVNSQIWDLHCYLQYLGLWSQENLWGLLVCHHRDKTASPRFSDRLFQEEKVKIVRSEQPKSFSVCVDKYMHTHTLENTHTHRVNVKTVIDLKKTSFISFSSFMYVSVHDHKCTHKMTYICYIEQQENAKN